MWARQSTYLEFEASLPLDGSTIKAAVNTTTIVIVDACYDRGTVPVFVLERFSKWRGSFAPSRPESAVFIVFAWLSLFA